MNLSAYTGKQIRVTDVDGEVFEGKCICFTPAIDNELGIDSIELETDTGAGYTIGFNQDEIANIETIG